MKPNPSQQNNLRNNSDTHESYMNIRPWWEDQWIKRFLIQPILKLKSNFDEKHILKHSSLIRCDLI